MGHAFFCFHLTVLIRTFESLKMVLIYYKIRIFNLNLRHLFSDLTQLFKVRLATISFFHSFIFAIPNMFLPLIVFLLEKRDKININKNQWWDSTLFI